MNIRKTGRILATLFFLSVAVSAYAQYRLFSWENFENATSGLPPTLKHGYSGSTDTTQPVPYLAPSLPGGIREGIARQENQEVGLAFKPTEDLRHLSLTHRVFLDRGKLGSTGSALVQADFYVPPPGQPRPNMALIAVGSDPNAKSTYRFYRFGVLDERLYFSFTNGGPPELYVQEPIARMNLEPGWHRFQIIFNGQQEIYCAVDGEFTGFSPINEPTLTRISPGIMVTKTDTGGTAIADNLSIQWTPEANTPLPKSPWKTGIVTARPGVGGNNPRLFEPDSPVGWYANTTQAWAAAQGAGKPLLVMFHVPEIVPYRYLVDLSPDDERTKQWFSQFVPLRIDINQLQGGRAAETFEVFRVPTLMVLGSDGRERSRVVVRPNQTSWNDILSTLDSGDGGSMSGG